MLQGNKCTKLFHSLAKRNVKKKFVAALIKDDGTTTTFCDIQELFFNFYKEFLGITDEAISIDETVDDFLVHDYSVDDIKNALFDIGDDKSPRPNGYTFTFFKKVESCRD